MRLVCFRRILSQLASINAVGHQYTKAQLPVGSQDLSPTQLLTSVFSSTPPPPYTHENEGSVEEKREKKTEKK